MTEPANPADPLTRWVRVGLAVALVGVLYTMTELRLGVGGTINMAGRLAGNWQFMRVMVTTPNAGESVLPKRVRDLLKLKRQYGVERYQLSPALAADGDQYQRIVEGLWPSQLEPQSRYLYVLSSEPLAVGGTVIASEGDVSLVRLD